MRDGIVLAKPRSKDPTGSFLRIRYWALLYLGPLKLQAFLYDTVLPHSSSLVLQDREGLRKKHKKRRTQEEAKKLKSNQRYRISGE
ncbi:hypothetical protein YC2023_043986 [Brassica napus]